MGTLRKIKTKMKSDKELKSFLVRSAKDEIFIDITGDNIPDIALMDSTGDGDIDTLAVDLTGDGEFNLYFHDTDGNCIPDMILLDEDGDGIIDYIEFGEDVESRLANAACGIFEIVSKGDYAAEKLDNLFCDLQKGVEAAKKGLDK